MLLEQVSTIMSWLSWTPPLDIPPCFHTWTDSHVSSFLGVQKISFYRSKMHVFSPPARWGLLVYRMPEDLPVTKCINVMVGITRSKVIYMVLPWINLRFGIFQLAESTLEGPCGKAKSSTIPRWNEWKMAASRMEKLYRNCSSISYPLVI